MVIGKVAAVPVQLGPLRTLIYDMNDDQSDLVLLRTDAVGVNVWYVHSIIILLKLNDVC